MNSFPTCPCCGQPIVAMPQLIVPQTIAQPMYSWNPPVRTTTTALIPNFNLGAD